MRIVFMGTPDFAVPCLEALIDAGHEIAAVYSQPDKPVGRKQIITPTPVKECALKHNLTVCQPKSLRSEEQLKQMLDFKPDVVAVVAYGKLIPSEMLKIAPLGFVNVHGSLLPKYRGAAPIQWAVVNGDKTSGVTTMMLNEGMDTGDILEVSETEIGENETAGELFDRLSEMGAELLLSTLKHIESGTVTPVKQDESAATTAPIIKKEMALLDFSQPAEKLKNIIRGFNPWPVAYTFLEGKRLKIYSAFVRKANGTIGTADGTSGKLLVYCGDGTALELNEVQLEGSKRMSATNLLMGHPIAKETKLG